MNTEVTEGKWSKDKKGSEVSVGLKISLVICLEESTMDFTDQVYKFNKI